MSPLSPQEVRENQIATTCGLIDGYNSWSIDKILAPRAPNCTHQILPTRLSRPEYDNETYKGYFASVMPLFKDFHATIIKQSHDSFSQPPTSALHVRSTSTTILGDYANEYTFLLALTDDGKRLTRIEEFVDSGFSADYFQRLRAKIAEIKSQEGQASGMS